jgi:phosphoribosylaminoimidazole-succinocarboxamide synthase
MSKPDLTTSELAARLKELDFAIVHQLDEFASNTGIDIADLRIEYDYDNDQFVMDYRLAFPEE